MDGKRIFIAIDISEAVRSTCSRNIDELRNEFSDVRVGWERPEKLHITLRFLGDVDEEVIEKLHSKLCEVAANFDPFSLSVSKTGVFPSASKPRILWVGIDDPAGKVESMYAAVSNACEELGFEPEHRSFKPHLTIARVREPERAKDLATAHLRKHLEPEDFEVSEIVIYESKLKSTGSVYSVLSRAKL